jgi:hypothetical protein
MNFSKIGPDLKHGPVLSLGSDIITVFLGLLRSGKVRFYRGSICRVRGFRLSSDLAWAGGEQ